MRFSRFVFIALSLIFGLNLFAQNTPQREWAIFNKGIQDYQHRRYDLAEKNFRTVLAKLQNGKLTTANFLMLAKTLYKQGKYQASLDTCHSFLKKYPDSKFSDDIRFLQGQNYYRLKRLQSAVSAWLYVAGNSSDSRLCDKALDLAVKTIRFRLQNNDLINLKKELRQDYSRRVILYYLAEKYYEQGNHRAALAALDEINKLSAAETILDKKIQQLGALLNRKHANTIRIAALLPLSGMNSDLGKAILDGARLAVNDFNRQHGALVEIVPFDYAARQINAIQKLREIAADPSICAAFGPVENDIAVTCAVVAGYEGIPLITPTATESGLRRLSSNVLQLSIPQDITTRILARYAQDSLGLQRFVTLAPMDDYFNRLTQSFIKHVQENNGEILSSQWYYADDRNVTNYFKRIKRIGLKQAYRDSIIQSDSVITAQQADSLYKIYLNEKQEYLQEIHTKVDSADIPVKSIDALYAPIYETDIGLIASQFAYWNIQTQLLGNEDWYNLQLLKKNKNYLNGLIFISDGYLNPEDWDYKKFRNNFRTIYKRTPEKMEIIGFDSFRFILSAIEKSTAHVNRENFLHILQDAPPYRGIYRSFNIGEKRFNNEARILKFSFGQILPLQ